MKGQSRKLTSRDKHALARLVDNCETKIALEAIEVINLERDDKALPVTVRRALRRHFIRAIKKAKKKPPDP